jgi:hypothetical protein
MGNDDDRTPRPSSGRATRRRFLTTAAAGTGAMLISGTAPQTASAAAFLEDTFDGLAAFVVPGHDRFSRHQRVWMPRPGGVDAQAGRVVRETVDSAVPLVLLEAEVGAPGALGVALLLESLALYRNPFAAFGPFSSPFANLSFVQKRTALQDLDETPVLKEASIEYAGNALITLAALGAYSEAHQWDPRARKLKGRPLGWEWSNYGGVSDGWPEFIGYLGDRTEVTA